MTTPRQNHRKSDQQAELIEALRCARRPALRQDLEASLPFGAANDFENEIPAGGGIHQSGAIISTVGTQMLEPWPPFPDGGNDLPDFGTVGNVRAGR